MGSWLNSIGSSIPIVGGALGLVGGLVNMNKSNPKADEIKIDDSIPYIVDSTGQAVSHAGSKVTGDRFGDPTTQTWQANPGKPPYYIVYPKGWPYDPSNDKVTFGQDGVPEIQFPDYLTADNQKKLYEFQPSSKHLIRATVVPVGDDGTPQFSKAIVPDGSKPMPNIASAVPSTTTSSGDATASIPTNTTSTTSQGISDPAGVAGLPSNIAPGMNQFVSDTQKATDTYNAKNDELWKDYLNFEASYFDKANQNINDYQNNINNLPKMNLKMPDSMGGGTFDLAPKQHSAMYRSNADTMNNLLAGESANASAAIPTLDSLAGQQLNTGLTQASNSLLPTNTALDLYKMERQGQLGIDQTEAAKTSQPSTSAWSTWAPVAGQLLQTGSDGTSILGDAYNTVKSWFNPTTTSTANNLASSMGNWFSPSDTSLSDSTWASLITDFY